MEIAVLVKPVPEAETRLRVRAAGDGLDPDGVKWVLAGYDESAVEPPLEIDTASRHHCTFFGSDRPFE